MRAHLAFGLLALLTASCAAQPPAQGQASQASTASVIVDPADAGLLRNLFAAVRADTQSAGPDVEALISGQRVIKPDDPNWPTFTYLLGEYQRQHGDLNRAKTLFSSLATWGVSHERDGPYGDTWGGSGLAAVSLWRWLQILDQQGRVPAAEIGQVVATAAKLRDTRLYRGIVQAGLLPAMPLLDEDVVDRLVHVAWHNDRHDVARSWFLEYLTIDSSGALDDTDAAIRAELIERGLANPERLDLLRARRQLSLVKTKAEKDQAAALLKSLWDNLQTPSDVRAEAGYEWANYSRQSDRADLVAVLTQVMDLAGDRPVTEKALYRRGMLHSDSAARVTSTGAWTTEMTAFRADMQDLLRRFPESLVADDALYELATEATFPTSRLKASAPPPDVDGGLRDYAALRAFKGANDYLDSASYLPALGLVGRNRDGDLDTADRLLEEYVKRQPDGVFRLRSIFWRARIAERKEEQDRARMLFQQVVDEAPYDYYGLRARMHLEDGAKAATPDLPAPSSRALADLQRAFHDSRVDPRFTGASPYHQRLNTAATAGLYPLLFEADKQLGRRLDDVPLQTLDDTRALPAVALLLALRQDGLAAKDTDSRADNYLSLANFLGRQVQDWSLAIEMTMIRDHAPHQRLADLQKDPRYLATVYPDPAGLGLKPLLADAAWPLGGSMPLSQSLMYAVMRHESRYYPSAISVVGALGLFQFQPQTFASLRARGLTEPGGPASDVEYLFDPGRNIRLWSRWVRTEFAKDRVTVALIKHQAGSGNLAEWTYWNTLGAPDDVEYRIETARFAETRTFLRRVLQDATIAQAAGFFN